MNFKQISLFAIFFLSITVIPLFTAQSASSSTTPKIKLFIYKNCPYCKNVINFLKKFEHLDDVELIEASDKTTSLELQKISGSTQCPYLVDGDTQMPESKDIIEYLKKYFKIRS